MIIDYLILLYVLCGLCGRTKNAISRRFLGFYTTFCVNIRIILN